jgi:four helix bundle protein
VPQERLNSFRDLRVWQLAKSLAVAVYRATEDCPPRERFGLSAQMRAAAVSVPANIAEGYERNNRAEYTQFLGIANGSLQELETHLLIAEELGISCNAADLLGQVENVGHHLTVLRQSLQEPQRP